MTNPLPVSHNLFRAASNAAYAIKRTSRGPRKVEQCHVYHGDPQADCQPWSSGAAFEDSYGWLTHAYHTELDTNLTISPELLRPGLWEMHPCVFRFPSK